MDQERVGREAGLEEGGSTVSAMQRGERCTPKSALPATSLATRILIMPTRLARRKYAHKCFSEGEARPEIERLGRARALGGASIPTCRPTRRDKHHPVKPKTPERFPVVIDGTV